MNTQLTKFRTIKYLLITLLMSLHALQASATILKDQKGLGWASFRDLTSDQFADYFQQYKDKYLLEDIDAYTTASGLRYSMVWRENTDHRGWAEHRNLSSAQYSAKWTEYKDKGYRPLAIAAYPNGSDTLFAGVWVQNKENIAWSSHRNLTGTEYGDLYTQKRNDGFRLVDMEAYQTSAGLRYSAIWYQNVNNTAWTQWRDMSRETYQQKIDELSTQGYTVVDFESYQIGSNTRYAAIWEKKPGYASQVRTERTETAFANLWRQYRDMGYRLVDFERYKTDDGDRYGGVWIENDARFNYSKKTQLDEIIQAYQEDNDLPGISVAVMKNGQSLYRRGFGYADINNSRWAHSETIYNAASVAKTIGGTLAAKLEEKQSLENGQVFSLDLSNPTRNYVAGLAAFHTHTVDQLLSHTGCVAHYTTTPAIANQTTHYATATAAVNNIRGVGLVSGCTPGNKYSYSTAGFTFVGAALEGATGKSISSLLSTELFKAHNLNDMRVQFAGTGLVADYERAVPYKDDNSPTSYSDNSWKHLGGGIETSAYELSRFGAKLLNGEIVNTSTRDNRLWKTVNSKSNAGLAWFVGTSGGRRIVDHDGSWTGARSYIRIYRDDDIVISIMSNRTNHSVGDVRSLANEIAAEVL
jgi:CubicO group peptidase (beta-lactamase class C family)